jgi:hypothetical protein
MHRGALGQPETTGFFKKRDFATSSKNEGYEGRSSELARLNQKINKLLGNF